MSGRMKKPHIKKNTLMRMQYKGIIYVFPKSVAEKYRVEEKTVSADDLFDDLNKKYTKAGALLRGLRNRENLTQNQMAEKIEVTQSDVSQMENGVRVIGRKVAKRIESLFDVDYRAFLE